jgi:predicted AlkP superfamily phosphohydrolase/phosphomutase
LNKFYLSELILFFNKTRRSREVFQRKLSVSSSVYYKYPGIYIRQDQLKDMKYWKLRDNLIRDLRQIRDPLSNEKVFQIVEKKKVIYSGNYTKFVPDIVALPNYKYNVIFSYDSNTLFDDVEMHLRGKHFSDIYGMLLASGKEMRQGTIKNASIYDIFPTVLHILDVSLPKDLDGKVLKSIFKPKSYLQNKRIVYSEVNVKTLQEKNNIQDVLQNIKF